MYLDVKEFSKCAANISEINIYTQCATSMPSSFLLTIPSSLWSRRKLLVTKP